MTRGRRSPQRNGTTGPSSKAPRRPSAPHVPSVASRQETAPSEPVVVASPLISSKSEARRTLLIVYLLLLAGGIVVALAILFTDGSLTQNDPVGERDSGANDSPKLESGTLSRALEAGLAEARNVVLTYEDRKKRTLALEEPSDLHATVLAMREMKKYDGSSASWRVGNAHAIECGNPLFTRYMVLRSPLPSRAGNPLEDLEYVIFRVYASGEEARKAYHIIDRSKETTVVQMIAGYAIVQSTHNMHYIARDVIDTMIRVFHREFLRIVDPPDRSKA